MAKRAAPKRLPQPVQPDSQEREYLRFLRLYSNTYQKLMREGLEDLLPWLKEEAAAALPVAQPRTDSLTPRVNRFDANSEKELRALFDSVRKALVSIFPDSTLRKWAQAMVGSVNRLSKRNTVKTAKAVQADVEPLMRDGELTPYFQTVVDENVGLIRSIPEERLTAFKNKLVAALTRDATQAEIREMIQDNFRTTKAKAALIARDQVGKLNGALNKYRQQQLGGKRYKWRTSNDSRVRHDHERLDGKIFSWDKPPVVNRTSGRRGNPGDDYQCRCWAEMVVEDILE